VNGELWVSYITRHALLRKTRTSTENIGDSGLIQAYLAWNAQYDPKDNDFLLPGLNYTRYAVIHSEFLYFISFAQGTTLFHCIRSCMGTEHQTCFRSKYCMWMKDVNLLIYCRLLAWDPTHIHRIDGVWMEHWGTFRNSVKLSIVLWAPRYVEASFISVECSFDL
jgi:hypothetical protein